MPAIDQAIASLAVITEDDVRSLPPAKRRRFADLCKHWAKEAEKPPTGLPTGGVVALLSRGDRPL